MKLYQLYIDASEKIEIKKYGFVEDNFSKILTELYGETNTIYNLSIGD